MKPNPPVTGGFPTQRDSNGNGVPNLLRHLVLIDLRVIDYAVITILYFLLAKVMQSIGVLVVINLEINNRVS